MERRRIVKDGTLHVFLRLSGSSSSSRVSGLSFGIPLFAQTNASFD